MTLTDDAIGGILGLRRIFQGGLSNRDGLGVVGVSTAFKGIGLLMVIPLVDFREVIEKILSPTLLGIAVLMPFTVVITDN